MGCVFSVSEVPLYLLLAVSRTVFLPPSLSEVPLYIHKCIFCPSHLSRPPPSWPLLKYTAKSFTKREIYPNLSGNEVYYAACSSQVMLKSSCSELYYQKSSNLIIFSDLIGDEVHQGRFNLPHPTLRELNRIEVFFFQKCVLLSFRQGHDLPRRVPKV